MPVIHADIGNDNWLPLPFLGEGAVSVTTVLIAMASSQDGLVFLDEVDAAIHHSHVEKFWDLVIRAAKDYTCQVFATTHSENALESAVAAAKANSSIQKLHYTRVRRTKSGDVKAVDYSGSELEGALLGEWEVR